jgi:hypothetical protein
MIKKYISIKRLALSLGILFSLFTLFPAVASATTGGTYELYGKFGQPHGYVISGNFTFIVQTKGPVDRVEFSIYKPNQISDVSKRLAYYMQTSITSGSDGTKYFNLVWDSTGWADGDYWLLANIESDSATPNGYRDFVTHIAGGNHLEFSVKNPKVTPPPTTPPEDSCSKKLSGAKKFADNIYNRYNKNLTYIDNFSQQTTFFYKENSSKLSNHDADLTKISTARKDASDDIVKLNTLKNFTCDTSLKDQAVNYLSVSADTRNKLDSYKDSVIDLMVSILGEYK